MALANSYEKLKTSSNNQQGIEPANNVVKEAKVDLSQSKLEMAADL